MRLNVALVGHDRVRALADGRVTIAGVDLDVSLMAPSEIFHRMLADDGFDVSEMSLSATLVQKQRERDWVVLPVFPFRSAFHTGFLVREHITRPEDLRGGRIGLVEYGVTGALWGRGVLADDFGVAPSEVTWVVERSGALSHSEAGQIPAPVGVRVEAASATASIGELLVAGDLDAVLTSPYPGIANRFNRTDEASLLARPGIVRLFRDPLAEARRYHERHGFLHANHVVVVRGEVARAHPTLVTELFGAFEAAKRSASARRDELRLSWLVLSHLYLERQDDDFGPDPFPYGVAANRGVIAAAARRSVADGLTSRALAPEEIFAPELLET